jgi:hypothetical protein
MILFLTKLEFCRTILENLYVLEVLNLENLRIQKTLLNMLYKIHFSSVNWLYRSNFPVIIKNISISDFKLYILSSILPLDSQ